MNQTTRRPRRRTRHIDLTPESRSADNLEAMLGDPAYAGWADELRQAHAELADSDATTAQAA